MDKNKIRQVIFQIHIFISMCMLFKRIRNYGFFLFILSLATYFLFNDFNEFRCFVLMSASLPIIAQILYFITKFIVAPIVLSGNIHSKREEDDLIYELKKMNGNVEEDEKIKTKE